MRENSILKQRIMQYLDFKGIKRNKFYDDTGVSNGVLSQNNGLSEDNLMRFLSFYPDISKEWLLTGKGEMIKPVNSDDEGIPEDVWQELISSNDKYVVSLEKQITLLEKNNALQEREIQRLELENKELKKASKHPISVPKMDKK